MPLIRLKKATPGNIVLIDFSSKHEIGKSSEKRVNPLRQIVERNVAEWKVPKQGHSQTCINIILLILCMAQHKDAKVF